MAYGMLSGMKVVILGANGMLGQDIAQAAHEKGWFVVECSRSQLDITQSDHIQSLDFFKPVDAVINCAAYTNVDACEDHSDDAQVANAQGPRQIAEWCAKWNIPMVHFSTDYVFDGSKPASDTYNESDACHPINEYGRSKFKGEEWIQSTLAEHYIFRVQWLYGLKGRHFVSAMKDLFSTKESLTIVSDQLGTPTWTWTVAQQVLAALEQRVPYGIYHLGNDGYTNWYEYACLLKKCLGYRGSIQAIPSTDFVRPATRPLNGQLNRQKMTTFWSNNLSWNEALEHFLLRDY